MSRKRHGPLPGDGWERWPHALGYSTALGDLRADIAPEVRPGTGNLEWHAVVWRGDDRDQPLFEAWGYPREAGVAARTYMQETAS